MIEDHIDDGDYVIIRQQETASNGETVVAMIDGEVTLSRYYCSSGQRSVSNRVNGNMKPIYVNPTSRMSVSSACSWACCAS